MFKALWNVKQTSLQPWWEWFGGIKKNPRKLKVLHRYQNLRYQDTAWAANLEKS